MLNEELEKEMFEKYSGFNKDWLAEGCWRMRANDLIDEVRDFWPELTDEERTYLSDVYSYPGGCFKLDNNQTKDGENELVVEVKTRKQLREELSFKYGQNSYDFYNKLLKENGKKMSKLDRTLLQDVVLELKFDSTNEK